MKPALMVFRLAVLIALLLGLGELLGFYHMTPLLRDVHIGAGLIVLATGAWLSSLTRQPLAWVATLLILIGGILPLALPPHPNVGWFHLIIMLLAVGLIEMVASRVKRHQS